MHSLVSRLQLPLIFLHWRIFGSTRLVHRKLLYLLLQPLLVNKLSEVNNKGEDGSVFV